jgi:PAS domain S-box-containing protein
VPEVRAVAARAAGPARRRFASLVSWTAGGVLGSLAVALAAWSFGVDAVPIPLIALGPLLSAIHAPASRVAVVTVAAIALALLVGMHEGLWGTYNLTVRAISVAAIGAVATTSARVREVRERELRTTRSEAVLAQRLRLALDAGRMGTWRWNLATDVVEWDERLEALFGLAPGTFDGTFETYERLLHPDDRERVLRAVDEGMRGGQGWVFDHRVIWPDGSVHWLEGRGDPVVDDDGTPVGATGVTIDVDERRALLDTERSARTEAERATANLTRLAEITVALSRTATVAEVASVTVSLAVEALDARSGYFATVDEDRHELVMQAQSGYPDWIVREYSRVPLDAALPATEALRTGEPILLESPEDRARRYPQFLPDATHAAFVVIPLPHVGFTSAVIAFGFEQARRYTDDDRRYIAAVAEACAQALQRATAFEAERQSRHRLRVLLDISEQFSRLDDPDHVSEAIASMAATRLGRCASVLFVGDDLTVRAAATAHGDTTLTARTHELTALLSDELFRKVLDTGEPLVVHDALEGISAPDRRARVERLASEVGCTSWLLVPIGLLGRRLAVLVIGDTGSDLFRPADVELTVDVARRGASALERTRLLRAEQQRANDALARSQARLRAEHRLVEQLQRTIMPDELAEFPGLELAAAYRPAEIEVDVGGDWYDAFGTPDGRVALVVGDVAGHGIEAANLMSRVRNSLRAFAVEDARPAQILRRLNRLVSVFDEHAMVTAFVACYDPATGELTWARAGHPPPLVCGRDGEPRFLEDVNGLPLGIVSDAYDESAVLLAPRSLVVCYTDGLVERRDRSIDTGLAWLAERVGASREHTAREVCQSLLRDPYVPRPSPDDVCLLVVRTGS